MACSVKANAAVYLPLRGSIETVRGGQMTDTPVRTAEHDVTRRDVRAARATLNQAINDQDSVKSPVGTLERFLAESSFDAEDPLALGAGLTEMIERGFDRLPLPGSGQTLLRWRALAAVAARDLGLVKLFEGHTDALAILAELQGPSALAGFEAGSRWGVWAAEAPDARLAATRVSGEGAALRLSGTKAWCSGAHVLSHALVTAWLDDQPVLAAVALDQSSVSISSTHWHAVGMRATQSGDVHFDNTPARLVGKPHAYIRRAGFWQGGAGIAACWYGAAAGIAQMLAGMIATRTDAHRLAHLGEVDVALAGAAEVLRASAAQIDAGAGATEPVTAQVIALRARLAVEAAANTVMHHAGRALGAAPLCRNERFARAMADLPVFLRQSHAERDLAALGEAVLASCNEGNQRNQRNPSTAAAASHTPNPWSL
jgi:alkylation response protein AidB-like acyl-CoA dehydrogenase